MVLILRTQGSKQNIDPKSSTFPLYFLHSFTLYLLFELESFGTIFFHTRAHLLESLIL